MRRIQVLESVYIVGPDGVKQVDERELFGRDGGLADALDHVAKLWAPGLDGRKIYCIDGGVRLLNMQFRKSFAKRHEREYPIDKVTPTWLREKQTPHARLLVLLEKQSASLLINASTALPKARRHHMFGYQLEPGSTDAMIFGKPMTPADVEKLKRES
jgi:hypothetical protein